MLEFVILGLIPVGRCSYLAIFTKLIFVQRGEQHHRADREGRGEPAGRVDGRGPSRARHARQIQGC